MGGKAAERWQSSTADLRDVSQMLSNELAGGSHCLGSSCLRGNGRWATALCITWFLPLAEINHHLTEFVLEDCILQGNTDRLISDKFMQIILMSPKDVLNFGTDHSVFIYLYDFFSTMQFHWDKTHFLSDGFLIRGSQHLYFFNLYGLQALNDHFKIADQMMNTESIIIQQEKLIARRR